MAFPELAYHFIENIKLQLEKMTSTIQILHIPGNPLGHSEIGTENPKTYDYMQIKGNE